MGYFISLDEYEEKKLAEEIKRRALLRDKGLCDYCERPHKVEPSCKFPERHNRST